MNRKRGLVKCVVFILVLGLLSISYAAHTNILIGDFSFVTGDMSFVFDSDNNKEVVVQMQNGSKGNSKDLGGTVSYDDKKLNITDLGPLDIEDLLAGDAIITICYAIKMETEEQSIKRPAEIKDKKDAGYDVGNVEFELMSHTPVWNIQNEGQSWGTATGNIGSTPKIIYDYLPDSLGEFHVYNTLLPHSEDGVMVGTLVLKQEGIPQLPKSMEIGLSSLNLPTEISNEIESGSPESTLEIEGTYGFSIPLNLDQFNVEK